MNLSTSYLGLELKNPVVAGASPMTESVSRIKRLEDAGAGAVVMNSLFEEQVRMEDEDLDYFLSYGSDHFAEALSYFPEAAGYRSSADAYIETLQKASQETDIPVLGSLNGVSNKGWTSLAKRMEAAGAAGIELNLYSLPTDIDVDATTLEARYVSIVRSVTQQVSIPVAVKMNPFFTSTANIAKKFVDAGAKGLVLFNRFYQPEMDLASLAIDRTLELSSPAEIRMPLRWTGILAGRLDTTIIGSTGVYSAEEALKYLLAGADAVQIASALLKNGTPVIGEILKGIEEWMGDDYASLAELKGKMSLEHVADPTAYERANYIKIISTRIEVPN